VIRLSPLQATLAISVVDGVPLPAGEEFTGVIRTQDVRATEKDKVKIGDCFRGGDVVKGLVACLFVLSPGLQLISCFFKISLGDARSYYVTTARNDLGVIFATSEAGEIASYDTLVQLLTTRPGATMEPVSWQEMRCPRTGVIERRKCAKPDGL
jgi:exosome complex component CSL4